MPQRGIGIGDSERGSILAGTMVISLVLIIGAAGLLMVTGAWSSSLASSLDRKRLLNASESGLHMGARWLRGEMTPDNQDVFTGTTAITEGELTIEGATVRVSLEHDPVGGTHTLVSEATMDDCNYFEIRWDIDEVAAGTESDEFGLLSDITFENWRESTTTCPN